MPYGAILPCAAPLLDRIRRRARGTGVARAWEASATVTPSGHTSPKRGAPKVREGASTRGQHGELDRKPDTTVVDHDGGRELFTRAVHHHEQYPNKMKKVCQVPLYKIYKYG